MTSTPRVIPVLLVDDGYLVKPVRFSKPMYIGDPINAVKIFNDKEVDELVVCDISASRPGKSINFSLIEDLASEAFMPVGYGGGIDSLASAERIITAGIEKVVLGSAAHFHPELITEISGSLGSQGTVVSVDAKRRITGKYETFVRNGTVRTGLDPVAAARRAEQLGAGEILLSSIDRESTFSGYDTALISSVAAATSVPIVSLGGAGSMDDFQSALAAGASAVAAGSMFVLNGKHRAVLITYPARQEIISLAT
jgi:cyclase